MAKAVWLKQGSEKYYPAPYWPIGSIYISVVNTNPSQWFGGTWVRFAKGRALVGVDDVVGDPDLTKVLKTGGEKMHTLTINEMPAHSHGITTYQGSAQWAQGYIWARAASDTNPNNTEWITNTSNTGGGQAHNNMPPYITVYMWRRIS